MASVLITQCLQRDFIEPVEVHVPLPNKLHVGRREALRLLGDEPQVGPMAQFLWWLREQPQEALEILHVRDWHDAEDARQEEHLRRFGPHCVKGTPGAALVLGLDQGIEDRPNEQVVNSITLNDFEGTSLPRALAQIRKRAGGQPIRVGVIGVWTEAKVSFLLYDLKTRGGFDELATCSALTASASRAQHFNALEQLRKILGVQVFDSPGDFGEWLVPDSPGQPEPPQHRGFRPELVTAGLAEDLDEADAEVLSFLYRDSKQVELNALTGGYSGARVFRAAGKDSLGQRQAPSVAKVGPRRLIGTERAAFERVEAVLGNRAPSIRGFVDFGHRAGIKYSFASMGGQIRTFQELYAAGLDSARTEAILREVFEEILEPFYAAALYERMPLLEYYTFAPEYAEPTARKVAEIHGAGGEGEVLSLADGSEVPNVARFYREYVPERLGRIGEYHFVSYVHGDLNGANILVDGRDNVWLIDFFHTERGHVLKDLMKLENDLLYIFTPLEDEAALAEALKISRALAEVEDLAAPLPERLDGVERPALRRAWSVVRLLRQIGARYVDTDRNAEQALIPMIRYGTHTLSFFESDALQKRWALSTACLAAERLMRRTADNRSLRIGWLDGAALGDPPGRLGLTLCPGRRDHGRSLDEDLDAIDSASIRQMWGLLTEDELAWAGVEDIAARAAGHGIVYHHRPILDQSVPTVEEARAISARIWEALEAGENVLVHCVGGLGRTGTLAACVAIDRGLSAEAAIALARGARGPRAIESAAQVAFVRRYAEQRR